MKRKRGVKEHPEVRETNNICDIVPNEKSAKDVCKVIKEKKETNK